MKNLYLKFTEYVSYLVDLPLLLVRILLAYAFFGPAKAKWSNMSDIISWFEYLNIPLPKFNAYLSATTEMTGVFLLLLGLGTRLISIPLIIVLLVAIFTVHIGNGWLAIADSSAPGVEQRLNKAKDILQQYGNYDWLTEAGNFVILNNGIEFPAMYILFLMVLLTMGPGKISIDYLISRFYK